MSVQNKDKDKELDNNNTRVYIKRFLRENT